MHHGTITFINLVNCPEEDAYRVIKEQYQKLYASYKSFEYCSTAVFSPLHGEKKQKK